MASWSEILASLFASHRQRLELFVARRTRDPETAADLTQEAFLRLARLPDGQKIEDPHKFLFTVAANLIRDHHRGKARRLLIAPGESGEDQAADIPCAEQSLAARQDLSALRAAIEALPPKTRTIFLLYRVEELPYRVIAERLDISPRTVEYHLRQALTHCREWVKRTQGDPS